MVAGGQSGSLQSLLQPLKWLASWKFRYERNVYLSLGDIFFIFHCINHPVEFCNDSIILFHVCAIQCTYHKHPYAIPPPKDILYLDFEPIHKFKSSYWIITILVKIFWRNGKSRQFWFYQVFLQLISYFCLCFVWRLYSVMLRDQVLGC